MRQLNFIDIKYLVEEINREIANGKIEKIYCDRDDFLLIIYTGVKKMLRILLPNYIFLTKYKKEYPTPTNFCMKLRKHLQGRIIDHLEQIDSERIVKIVFKSGYKLVIELFSDGNLILLDENDKIIQPYHYQKWSSRNILPGEIYKPPESNFNFFELTYEDFVEMLKNTKYDSVVKFVAAELRFGKFYAELLTGDLRDLRPSEVNPKELWERIKIREFSPTKFEDTFLPFAFEGGEPANSFSELIDEAIHEKEKEIIVESPVDKFKAILEEQEKKVNELKEKAEEYKKAGDWIYLNYSKVEEAIEKFKKGEAIPYKVEYPYAIIDGIKIDLRKSVVDNAEEYYAKYKKMKKKVKGAIEAMELVKRKMEEAEEEEREKIEEIRRKIEQIERRVKEWYEDFNWRKFGEFLAVGGKNAKQNEILIEKHLSVNDIVFHADIHGSPFVILKNGIGANDRIKTFAAQFTLCYSRAWKEKIPVDVYWVRPNQVKKSAPSGEYLPFGSFLIVGKKNFVRGLPLEWAIGVVDYKVISGPKEYVSELTDNFVVIIPGEKSRDQIAKEVRDKLAEKDKFIKEIPIEHFVRHSIDSSELLS